MEQIVLDSKEEFEFMNKTLYTFPSRKYYD